MGPVIGLGNLFDIMDEFCRGLKGPQIVFREVRQTHVTITIMLRWEKASKVSAGLSSLEAEPCDDLNLNRNLDWSILYDNQPSESKPSQTYGRSMGRASKCVQGFHNLHIVSYLSVSFRSSVPTRSGSPKVLRKR